MIGDVAVEGDAGVGRRGSCLRRVDGVVGLGCGERGAGRFFFFAARAEQIAPSGGVAVLQVFTTDSQNVSNGKPSIRSAVSKATISDSVEE